MSNDEFASLIARLAAANTPPELVGEVAAALAASRMSAAASADGADTLADRRRKDAERKRLARARVQGPSADAADTPSPAPAPSPEKETPPPAPPLKKNKPQPVTPTLFGDAIASDTPFALESEPAPTKTKRGTRLPADWALPKPWGDWALGEFPFLTVEAVRSIADDFRDYWAALPGAKGLKLDWLATWRNSVRMKAGRYRGGTPGGRVTKAAALGEELRQEMEAKYGSGREASGDLRPAQRLLATGGKAGS